MSQYNALRFRSDECVESEKTQLEQESKKRDGREKKRLLTGTCEAHEEQQEQEEKKESTRQEKKKK